MATSTADQVHPGIGNSRILLLVVDGERPNREMISHNLKSEGYELLTAQDGLDALNSSVEPLPNLIVSDLNMPRMSGFEFVEVVRRRFPNIPVLAISGELEGNEMPSVVLADAYLEKRAYSVNQLRTKIRELLSTPPRRQSSAVIGFSSA